MKILAALFVFVLGNQLLGYCIARFFGAGKPCELPPRRSLMASEDLRD